MNYSFWDWHGQNFRNAREELPVFDQGVSALVEDLHERGLDKDCSVVVWGEFGRTPKINKDAGRDHWPARVVRVAGRRRYEDRAGARCDRPSGGRTGGSAGNVRRSACDALSQSGHPLVGRRRMFDFRGRPQYIVEPNVKPIAELVG